MSFRNLTYPIIGTPKNLSLAVLPTYGETFQYYFYVQNTVKFEEGGKDPGIAVIASRVADELLKIWQRLLFQRLIRKP